MKGTIDEQFIETQCTRIWKEIETKIINDYFQFGYSKGSLEGTFTVSLSYLYKLKA